MYDENEASNRSVQHFNRVSDNVRHRFPNIREIIKHPRADSRACSVAAWFVALAAMGFVATYLAYLDPCIDSMRTKIIPERLSFDANLPRCPSAHRFHLSPLLSMNIYPSTYSNENEMVGREYFDDKKKLKERSTASTSDLTLPLTRSPQGYSTLQENGVAHATSLYAAQLRM